MREFIVTLWVDGDVIETRAKFLCTDDARDWAMDWVENLNRSGVVSSLKGVEKANA